MCKDPGVCRHGVAFRAPEEGRALGFAGFAGLLRGARAAPSPPGVRGPLTLVLDGQTLQPLMGKPPVEATGRSLGQTLSPKGDLASQSVPLVPLSLTFRSLSGGATRGPARLPYTPGLPLPGAPTGNPALTASPPSQPSPASHIWKAEPQHEHFCFKSGAHF